MLITIFILNIGINKNIEIKKKTMNNSSKDLITIEELCKMLYIGHNTALILEAVNISNTHL